MTYKQKLHTKTLMLSYYPAKFIFNIFFTSQSLFELFLYLFINVIIYSSVIKITLSKSLKRDNMLLMLVRFMSFLSLC